MCRVSELNAHSNGNIHTEFGLTRGDVLFFLGTPQQLTLPASRKCAARVAGRFRGSKRRTEMVRGGCSKQENRDLHVKTRLGVETSILWDATVGWIWRF